MVQHVVHVYVISATLWQVMLPVLMLAVGAVVGAVTSAWIAIISDRRQARREMKQTINIDNK